MSAPNETFPNPKCIIFVLSNLYSTLPDLISFGSDKLLENYETVMDAIIKAKPAAAKGQYVKSVAIATSMGPSIYLA